MANQNQNPKVNQPAPANAPAPQQDQPAGGDVKPGQSSQYPGGIEDPNFPKKPDQNQGG